MIANSSRIEDYALIGDCESAALVSRDGSIDWLCWPRFDSDAVFAALLGTPEHGRFRVAPEGEVKKVTRRYRPNTLILETRFETATGTVTLIDFMPIRGRNPDCVRIVAGERGSVKMCAELVLRFGYGEVVPWVRKLGDGALRAIAGPDMVVLRTPVHLHGENMKTVGAFTVSEGDRVPFVLSYGPSHLPIPEAFAADAALQDTETFWNEWSRKGRSEGEWSDAICRSLITLKALTYAPTGGMVAAPTTSLPEWIGGNRNWDYRFCWVRDATLTLLALMNAGYFEEAQAWRDWLTRAVAGRPEQMEVMYGVAGERRLTEWEVPWLPGYEKSAPVRIGNAAHSQLQLDVFGEVMDTLHQGRRGGLSASESGWDVQIALLRHLEKIWREPDHGIWEVRTEPQHFTYSKAMVWVAFDRAIKSADMFGLPGDVARWRSVRDDVCADVTAHGWSDKRNSFARTYGGSDLDASLLLLAPVGFLKPDDPRYRATVEAIERDLVVDGLVLRYDSLKSRDGLPAGAGAFLACSFWLADAYLLLGRRDDAERLFKHLVGLANDVGLLSEEYDSRAKRHLGNFPQAFSHVALINTAFNLTRARKPAEQRSELPTGTAKAAETASPEQSRKS
ncbi:MAG TPA: glycoside hydrolase family 15 protein [Xanthobacteraceae bacterium]|nr:glycoside hydrolase family 15 protein [Xanthobacteraceae bacterium]